MSDTKHATKPFDIEGMPPGIPYIVGNEAAERFSFYGMKAILTVFMTQYLLGADGEVDAMSGLLFPVDRCNCVRLAVRKI